MPKAGSRVWSPRRSWGPPLGAGRLATSHRPPLIRVLLVGEDPLARSGLAALLADQPGLAVTAQIAASDDWATILDAYDPEVAVWDVGPASSLPPPDFAGVGRPVLALVTDEEQAGGALGAGARGVLFRDARGGRLAAAVA